MTSGPRDPGARRAGGRPPRGGRSIDPAREVALDVLRAVSASDAYANLLLPGRLREAGVSGRDAAFATELVSGTLRRLGTYDAVLAACVDRPLARLHPAVLEVLRLGSHQLLSMRVPPHAAVDTSVGLARRIAGGGAAGLVNAVLRRVGERPFGDWVRAVAPDPGADPLGFAAVAHAHPRWVAERLAEALGDRAHELDALLAADNEPPRVTLVARPGLAGRDELVGDDAQPTPWSPLGAVLRHGDPREVAAVAEGRAGVQDEGSQLVALALAGAEAEGPDGQWLDLCAGPGGKAALLGGMAAQRGAHLLANERQPHRAALVARATAALPPGAVGVVTGDGTAPAWEPGSFDRVLVDAPCTGLGALRRRPEARWRRRPEDLDGLVPLQRRLLASAVASVRPGGVVAYTTCSPVVAEGADVVRAALRDLPVRLVDAPTLLPGVPDCAGPLAGTAQLWPHRHGTDAMFLAVLRREA